MMWVELLLLAALSLSTLSNCEVLYVMTAPNPLRVGCRERVFVEAKDYKKGALDVKIKVLTFPAQKILLTESVTLNSKNKFQALKEIEIKVEPGYFDEDSMLSQYVYLKAEFGNDKASLEKVVLVSFQNGYIFIQTDKTIYTPESKVNYRIFALKPDLQPFTDTIYVDIMTPDGITLMHQPYKPSNGIQSATYQIPEISSLGNWKIVAKLKDAPLQNFTTYFEVKEYVLPSFEVKLTLSQSFFYIDDEQLTVTVEARYLFEEPVTGIAFVVFGVIQENERTSFPGSLQRVELKSQGTAKAVLKIEHIKETIPDIYTLLMKSLYVSVNVLTDTGSEMVKAEKMGIYIVKSPYTLHFKKTPLYFKPGMPYDISVYATNPDDSPAKGIVVTASHKEHIEHGTTQDNGIAKMTINTDASDDKLLITVETKVDKLGQGRQGTQKMTAMPYKTKNKSGNYIHINIHYAEVKIGDLMKALINLGSSPAVFTNDIIEITYLILSKGQIIHFKKLEWKKGQGLLAVDMDVTKNMVPSIRVVAYYHVGTEEVVSDSVWVDVLDTCMGKLTLDAVRLSGSYAPQQKITLSLSGDSGATVGLVAVDKGVYALNNKNRLTQTQIWDKVEKYDTGCTAGSGEDSMGVFHDAGLVFTSNTAGGTRQRTVSTCPLNSRRRRAVTIKKVITILASRYTGLNRQCCMDGMRKNILDYTCQRRSQYVIDGPECVKAFLECCREMATKHEEAKFDQLILARSEESVEKEGEDEDFNDIGSRTVFPESWLWKEVTLPDCPTAKNCDTLKEDIYLPDSITSWQITAISLSKTHGICVADPLSLIVRKNFFIDLKLPYSAVRNEQLEIKAILHNYLSESIKVRVELKETPHICSSASKKGRDRVTVEMDSMSTRSVPFVIIPMMLGRHSIEVKALVPDSGYQDGVKKDLLVVAEGVLTKLLDTNVELDPAKHGGVDIVHVRSGNLADQVPNTPASRDIRLTGEHLARTIEAALSGSPLGDLLRQPGGCGEQNMMGMTMPVIATHYLDNTKQWDQVGLERRREAISFIQSGYDRQIGFRKDSGSFAIYPDYDSGTWLTAYVVKVFAMASPFIEVKSEVLCKAVKWLFRERQKTYGVFEEFAGIISSSMMGDVLGNDKDDTLTAFVLIAMQEANPGLLASMNKAKEFLKYRNPSLTNPYSVALTSLALANEGELNKDILFRHSSTDRTHWPVKGNPLLTLEATAYALLALVKANALEDAGPIVKWLNSQQFKGGYGSSTQATIMVFQAVAEYMTKAGRKQDIDLNVDINISGRKDAIGLSITQSNSFLTRSNKVSLDKSFNVTARGKGQGKLSVSTTPIYVSDGECVSFTLPSRTLIPLDCMKASKQHYRRSSHFSLFSYFCLQLSTGRERYIQKFEMDKKLSERGSLIIYLEKVSNDRADTVAFRIHKVQDVGLLQPVGVTVYEYYDPGNRCVKFYHPLKQGGTLNQLCNKDVCRCAEENCSFQRKNGDKSTNVKLFDQACKPGMDYGKNVISFNNLNYIFSLGTDPVLDKGQRMFLSHPSCREALNFSVGQTYLLIGEGADCICFCRFEYVLGERTWIEYYPAESECSAPRSPYRDRCLEIEDFIFQMEKIGCEV
uniref:Anaphylatoxin-like domain-containing protein n=1 Tax=Esox lucius TaxID=8010 RepID=A0A3P9A515_ESOLU